jgi:RNA polymerase sigma-70 factor (ECF subfamily)
VENRPVPLDLNAVVRQYQPIVYRFGLRMCGDPDEAADVSQETLLSLVRSASAFRAEASLSTWLFAIARNACLRRRRRRTFEPARFESIEALADDQRDALAAAGQNPEEALEGRELQLALERAIASLKPAEREVLLLRDVEGLTAAETARVVGVNVAAVKSRLHRARLAVRARLEPVLGPAPATLPAASDEACPDVAALLSRHLEGDLAPSTCAEMMTHVERCPRCSAACESLKRVLALCRDAPAPRPPPALSTAVRDAVRAVVDARGATVVRRAAARRGSSSSRRVR